jgi:hypothetical protein
MAKILTTIYKGFGGVDFSVDSSLVDKNRSPWAPNMIADVGEGMPEKRVGWRTLFKVDAPIHGIFAAEFMSARHLLVHGGTKMYLAPAAAGDEPKLLREGLKQSKSAALLLGGKLWIVTGGEYLVYDGVELKPVSEAAYIPTTVIGRAPTGGGVFFEAINLLSPWRKNEFIPNGTATVYQLDATGLDAAAVSVTIRGTPMSEGAGFTVDRGTGRVTFNSAPAAPVAGQEGEVVVTFAKTVAGYVDKINKCNIISSYGRGSPDRVVLAGNPDSPNLDWISGFNDPSYVPDLSYTAVGGPATAILGYAAIGEYLAIIKESSFQSSFQDATVFMRWAALDSNGEVVFPLRQSIANVGAVSRDCIGYLNDEPLFLSPGGVVAITSNIVTAERMLQNRSYYLDGQLSKEEGLSQATAVTWRGYYTIAVNNRCYILDGRKRSYRERAGGEYIYEGYHWQDVPVRCWCNIRSGDEEDLFFGTAEGTVCRFNSDLPPWQRYNDDGRPIFAAWASLADDDGDATREKTLLKKGAAVTLKPYRRSSAHVCFRTDRDCLGREVRYETADIFDWEDIDFARFTFISNDGPREVFFRAKVKKYKRLQIIIFNDGLDEGFGVLGITKHYVVGNFAKQ